MHLTSYSKVVFFGIFFSVLIGGTAHAGQSNAGAFVTDKVVMIMREGATSGASIEELERYTQGTWPKIDYNDGDLTDHGRNALRLWGQYHRRWLAQSGLWPIGGDLAADQLTVFASPLPSAQNSANAFIQGLAPYSRQRVDPTNTRDWFLPARSGLSIDDYPAAVAAADRAMRRVNTGPQRLEVGELNALESVLHIRRGNLSLMRWDVVGDIDGLDIHPLGLIDRMTETVRMQYVNNLPMHDVGFGRIGNREALSQLLAPRRLPLEALQDPPFLASRRATPLLERLLVSLLSDESAVSVFLGHDVNVASIRASLGFNWETPDNLRNDVVPGGALVFERMRRVDSDERFVRISYRAPTMYQLRHLQPFDRAMQPFITTFEPAPSPGTGSGGLIPLEQFRTTLAGVFEQAGRGRGHDVTVLAAAPPRARRQHATCSVTPSVTAHVAQTLGRNRTASDGVGGDGDDGDNVNNCGDCGLCGDCLVPHARGLRMDSVVSPF